MVLTVDVAPDLVHGDVNEGYGAVADGFRRNFAERGEIGAACVVHRDGRKVVDLWGGYRDGVARKPWESDTVVTTFSGRGSAPPSPCHTRPGGSGEADLIRRSSSC